MKIVTAREQIEMLSPWRVAAFVFPWRESEAYPGKGFFADLENGHKLSVLPPHPRDPSRGWDWYLWHGQKNEHGEHPVTGGGQGWRNDSRAHSTDHLPTAEDAKAAAEDAYSKLFPIGTNTGPHDSGVDYSDLNKFMGEL